MGSAHYQSSSYSSQPTARQPQPWIPFSGVFLTHTGPVLGAAEATYSTPILKLRGMSKFGLAGYQLPPLLLSPPDVLQVALVTAGQEMFISAPRSASSACCTPDRARLSLADTGVSIVPTL